jgi:general stress protein 26
MQVDTFVEIEAEFLARVNKMVWCAFTTIDFDGNPRSRIVHTLWEGANGWIAARRHSPKSHDLAVHPRVAMAYIADIVRPVYVSGTARWAEDLATKRHVWDLFSTAPPPLGYDPGPIYGSVESPDYGVLLVTPLQIELGDVSGTGVRRLTWRAEEPALDDQ